MIEPDKRKAIFLLHQEGMSVREISRRLGLSRNTRAPNHRAGGADARPLLYARPLTRNSCASFTRSATATCSASLKSSRKSMA